MISGFAKLRADLAEVDDLYAFDTTQLLDPFLEVIRSQATNGFITSLALSTVSNFFAYELITIDSPKLSIALRHLVDAVTHCRFEATDQAEDDGVLLKILSLMGDIVQGPLGPHLSDNSICEILETCLSMACQMRRGDILRRSAEMTMTRLCQSVFQNLKDMKDDVPLGEEGDVSVSVYKEGADYQGNTVSIANTSTPPGGTPEVEPVSDETEKKAEQEETDEIVDQPYGIASIREILRVLISIIDPANYHQYTDSTRILSLKLLTTAFEVGGESVGKIPSLIDPVSSVLAKYLCQLVRMDNPPILSATLRMAQTLIHTNCHHLKLQLEFLLSYVLTCLSQLPDIPREQGVDSIFYDSVPNTPKLVKPSPTASLGSNTPKSGSNSNFLSDDGGRMTPTQFTNMKSPEIRELMIEFLVSLTKSSRTRGFFTDIFVNYDCDVDRTDLCEDTIGFLCRNAYPDSAVWSTSSVPPLCLDAILAFIAGLVRRQSDGPDDKNTEEEVQATINKRSLKKLSIAVTQAFNESPKKGIKMMVDTKFIPNDSPECIAQFLKSSGRLNKTVLGEYLTKGGNKEVMDKFVELFDFSNTRLDEALREFVSFFRLPGESQLIERIFEKFSKQYCQGTNNTQYVSNEDSAFVLSYAVILLNTDMYNPQIKRHMTMEDFARNLRGANDGKNFAPEILEEIYKAIRAREIVLPDEHDTDETFEYAWRNLLIKQAQAGSFTEGTSMAYDKQVFDICWKPIVTTLSYVFATATDDMVFSRLIIALNQMAQLGAAYQTHGAIDHIIACLSWISTLPAGDFTLPTNNLEVEIVSDDKQTSTSVTVSDLSVSFGGDFKAQMATVTLFRVASSCIDFIETGWQYLIPSLANLYLFDLTPPIDSVVPGMSKLGRVKPKRKFKRSRAGKESGIFSALSSYLTGYNDGVTEPTDEEVEATFCALDCVSSAGIEDFASRMLNSHGSTLDTVVKTLMNCVPNITQASNSTRDSYYSVISYFLECATNLALKDESGEIAQGVAKMIAGDFLDNWQLWKTSFLCRIVGLYLALQRHSPTNISLEPVLKLDEKVLQSGSSVFIKSLLIEDSSNDLVQWEMIAIVAGKHPKKVFEFAKKYQDSGRTVPTIVWDAICNSTKTPVKDDSHEEIALESLNLIFSLEEADSKNNEWVSLTQSIAHQILNINRKVRSSALTYLEKLLLSPDLVKRPDFQWDVTFETIIFPTVRTLLKPEIYELDSEGMGATRLHFASLLCKAFLQYIVSQQQTNNGDLSINLWTQILDTLDRLMNSSQRESMKESVAENLKNALLVVKTSNLGTDEFWKETWQRIDKFMPALRAEVEGSVRTGEEA